MSCACHRETDIARFSSHALRVRADALTSEAAAFVSLLRRRRSQRAPFGLHSILQPRFVLLDKPEGESEWSLQKGKQTIRSYQFSSFERGLHAALFFWRRVHFAPPAAAASMASISL